MILFIDNYDSFTYNLVQFCGSVNPDIKVVRNDEITVDEIKKLVPSHIILSPGPGYPKDAGICEEVIKELAGQFPILGICLGHQAICEVYGATISHAIKLMHGKKSDIIVDTDKKIFNGLPKVVEGARYHSLIAKRDTVPDTRNVGKDAMKADGTINRAALPAIFNPEDLNALEQALRLKDAHPGSTVTILTMGPGRAADIIREGLFRGADNGYLLTDRAFAGADTLATSYALATAIRKIGECDIIIGGRQAIDGDTAQVGPQVAEKLGLTQITYAEEILEVGDGKIKVKRHIDGGVETVEGPLPIVITVNGSAAPCRPRNAKLVQKYKHAKTVTEKQQGNLDYTDLYDKRDYLNLTEWSVADVNGDLAQCGLSGSPTKVKAIQNIVFQAKESKTISGSDRDVEELIVELLANHTIG